MLSVAFASSASDIDAALWESCFPPPLEGRWWYQTLEQSRLEDQFSFLYGVIERDGIAVGIASMVLVQTLSTIFQSGVYIYAITGEVPPTLDRALVESAFKPKA